MRVLIAPLGMTPLVITEAVVALRESPEGPRAVPQQVVLLYPNDPEQPERFIDYGAQLLQEVLRECCGIQVRPVPLPFADPSDGESCITYLRLLRDELEAHRQDEVFLLVSGGRKNTSALTAVPAQFYPNIHGLYHVLDALEGTPEQRRYSVEDLQGMDPAARRRAMFPPVNEVRLVPLPFARLSDAEELRRYLTGPRREEEFRLSAEAEEFFRGVFGTGTVRRLAVWLSAAAEEDFTALGPDRKRWVRAQVLRLADPDFLEKEHQRRYVAAESDCWVHPQGRHPLRILFSPSPREGRLVVQRILSHAEYDRFLARGGLPRAADFPPYLPLEHLPVATGGTLVAPVGLSPMVVSQIYRLLEREGRRPDRLLLLPTSAAAVQDGVRMLEAAFRARVPRLRPEVRPLPVQDVACAEDCTIFAAALQHALREADTDKPRYLSIAGGRKAMAAVAYYAAQMEGIPEVLHTTIVDEKLERQVIGETSPAALADLAPGEQQRRLFLDAYAERLADFRLIMVPVVPLHP